mmetsp:Transcript_53026/g.105218  ORF Transcript_53026/g.105218 Transcript_53026/m.105218 type:complete len:323 (-) Transcript_53026:224-1192(-)
MASTKREPGMIFLKQQNMIVEEALGTRMFDEPPKREPCDITVADFDDVKFKVVVAPANPAFVAVHISLGAVGAKIKTDYFGQEVIEATFPGMTLDPEAGFDFAVGVDLDSVKEEDKSALLYKISSLRRYLLGAPFIKAFQGVQKGDGAALPFMVMETRSKEAVFIKPGNDRCTTVFSFNFSDETDNAIARVMLQQFAKESAKVNGAPPCQYAESKNPPLEIRDAPKLSQYADGCGFISFVIFASHLNKPEKFDKVVTMQANFRNYLHYHIKASKTYLHMRMRKKVGGWLQALNRSHHDKTDGEKGTKTASGKTFKRSAAVAK